ncbi:MULTISPECIES: sugar ABC transporter permease [unclassified Streptomyces]|uniref:carbohydrate ABC transporter permease n=1 Tax=unclassified Streptomyces TaxID=2593676 RepID=UPI000F5BA5B8|nr:MULTISPECIES: sugar ABC transporter permease [unclassified Streptomyces]WSG49566.1 sugar ABC transporter permease [Streptomyces sp. NBC_01732]WSX00219.1 sugar ABC transporter permease [Streptomyces sp. NBC_00987]MCX4397989.1 sugar ABC transporter permease [Streptomyces sp. NBC_01767]MCX5099313.1 sugar ABC transporter permease [Streptomyces sp. NBC_00439]MCX5158858.1 sugar ABC transporter permease [Streptomyces sp. NBC_00305]
MSLAPSEHAPATATAAGRGTTDRTGRTRPGRRRLLTRTSVPYLLIMPAVLGFAIFKAYPIVASLWISLTTGNGAGRHFTGLDNYQRLLNDPLFWTALKNTALILVVQVPLMLGLALLIALGLNSTKVWLRPLWRLGVFVPSLTGLVAAGVMFSVILNRDAGLLNWVLSLFGIDRVNWLGSPFWARVGVVLVITWHYTGYNAVIYLAGLQGIPQELYEAAKVDGAGPIRRFVSITLPQLRPILLLTVVLSTIGTLQLFDEPYVLTGGGPDNATLTVTMYLYNNGFKYFDFGYASALAYALALIVAVLGFLQVRLMGERK